MNDVESKLVRLKWTWGISWSHDFNENYKKHYVVFRTNLANKLRHELCSFLSTTKCAAKIIFPYLLNGKHNGNSPSFPFHQLPINLSLACGMNALWRSWFIRENVGINTLKRYLCTNCSADTNHWLFVHYEKGKYC